MYEEPRAPSRSERPAHQRQGSRQASVSSNTAPQYNSTANDVVIPNKSRLREEDAPSPFDNRPDKPGTSRNDVIIPNKSRMREEEIEVPYARDSSLVDDRPTSAASSRRLSRISQASSYKPAATPRAEPAPDMLSPQSNDDRNYYERLSFSSNVTSKSKMPAAEDEREQKIRSDYEFRIAGLERRALAAESERDECRRREVEEKEKRVEWEDEVRGLKEVRQRLKTYADYCDSALLCTPLHCGRCSTSWTWRETRRRRLVNTWKSLPAMPKKRLTNGEIGAKGWRTISGTQKPIDQHQRPM